MGKKTYEKENKKDGILYRRAWILAGMSIVAAFVVLLQIFIEIWTCSGDMEQNEEKQLRLMKQALTAEFYNNAEIVKSLETYQDVRPFFLQNFPAKGSELVQNLNAHFTNNNIVDDIFMYFFCDEYFYSTKTSFSTKSFMNQFNFVYDNGQTGERFLEQMQSMQKPFFIRDVISRQSASQTIQNKYILYVYPYWVDQIIQGAVIFQINEANLNSWIGNDYQQELYIFDTDHHLLNCSQISNSILEVMSQEQVDEMMNGIIAGQNEFSYGRYRILGGAVSDVGLFYIQFHTRQEAGGLWLLLGSYFVLLLLLALFFIMLCRKLFLYNNRFKEDEGDVAEFQMYYGQLRQSLDNEYKEIFDRMKETLEQDDLSNFRVLVKQIRKKMIGQDLPETLQHYILEKLVHMASERLECLNMADGNLIESPEIKWNGQSEALLELLERQIDALYEAKKKQKKSQTPPLTIEAVIREIEINYCDENFSLQMLADYFGLSLSYLSLFFKERHGDNLLNYYTKLRMEKAKELLQTTQLSQKEIAARIGYSNVSSFIRRFKQLYGMTPGNYKSSKSQVTKMETMNQLKN